MNGVIPLLRLVPLQFGMKLGISKERGNAGHSIKSLKKIFEGWFRTAALGIFRQMSWSIPEGRKKAPKLILQWDFPWIMTTVLPLGQVSLGDEEEQDALVVCHCPGGEYGLVHPIPSHPSASLMLKHHPIAV